MSIGGQISISVILVILICSTISHREKKTVMHSYMCACLRMQFPNISGCDRRSSNVMSKYVACVSEDNPC